GNYPEPVINGAKLRSDAHAHVAVGVSRRTFRVEGDEVEWRAGFAGGEVRAPQTMFEECASEPAAAAGGIGPADTGCRQSATHTVNSVVVQFEKLLRCPAPISDIGLIPNFPEPGFHLRAAIAL